MLEGFNARRHIIQHVKRVVLRNKRQANLSEGKTCHNRLSTKAFSVTKKVEMLEKPKNNSELV